jgi:hypothetical protein
VTRHKKNGDKQFKFNPCLAFDISKMMTCNGKYRSFFSYLLVWTLELIFLASLCNNGLLKLKAVFPITLHVMIIHSSFYNEKPFGNNDWILLSLFLLIKKIKEVNHHESRIDFLCADQIIIPNSCSVVRAKLPRS